MAGQRLPGCLGDSWWAKVAPAHFRHPPPVHRQPGPQALGLHSLGWSPGNLLPSADPPGTACPPLVPREPLVLCWSGGNTLCRHLSLWIGPAWAWSQAPYPSLLQGPRPWGRLREGPFPPEAGGVHHVLPPGILWTEAEHPTPTPTLCYPGLIPCGDREGGPSFHGQNFCPTC